MSNTNWREALLDGVSVIKLGVRRQRRAAVACDLQLWCVQQPGWCLHELRREVRALSVLDQTWQQAEAVPASQSNSCETDTTKFL